MRRLILAAVSLACLPLLASPQGNGNDQSVPLPESFLAEGPMKINIKFEESKARGMKEAEEKKCDLVVLTETKLVYRTSKGELKNASPSRRGTEIPPSGYVTEILSVDGKPLWTAEKAKFKGETLPPPPALKLTPKKFNAEQEQQYLFFVLQQLTTLLDEFVRRGDGPSVEILKKNAKATAEYVAKRGLSAAILKAFNSIDEFADGGIVLTDKLRKVVEDSESLKEITKRQKALAVQRLQEKQTAGALGVGIGLIFDSPDLARNSLMYLDLAQDAYRFDQGVIAAVTAKKEGLLATEFLEVQDKLTELRKKRDKMLADLLNEVRLPPSLKSGWEWAAWLAQHDPISEIKALEGQAKTLNTEIGWCNPWLTAYIARRHAYTRMGDDTMQAEMMHRQAQAIFEAAAMVPAGKFFDAERVALLRMAAQIATEAAKLEVGTKSWQDAYHLSASYALRIYTLVDSYEMEDFKQVSEQSRMVALALTMQPSAALNIGKKIEDVCKGQPIFHFHMARLHGVRYIEVGKKAKDRDEAVKHAVISHSFRGWKNDLFTNPEMAGLLREFKATIESKLTPNVECSMDLPVPGGNGMATARLENKSAFHLTNMTATIHLIADKGGNILWSANEKLQSATLPSGTKTSWEFALPKGKYPSSRLNVLVECDQAKKVFWAVWQKV